MTTVEKLAALRECMKREGVDAYIILTSDAHVTEYLPDYWQCRKWISGFTGSAGAMVVTESEAHLWIDGRYWISGEEELRGTTINMQKMGSDGVLPLQEWVKDNLKENAVVGVDGRTMPVELYRNYQKEFKKKKLKTRLDLDLVGEIWKDRPAFPKGKAFEHDIKFAGKTRPEKLAAVRERMVKEGADYYLVSPLDGNAWLFNYRGTDTPGMPTIYAYAFISKTEAILFADDSKLVDIKANLIKDGIIIKNYDEIFDFLKNFKDKGNLFIDTNKLCAGILDNVPENLTIFEGADIVAWLKSQKNPVEIENLKKCHARECSAVTKFIKWVKEAVKSQDIYETDVQGKLDELRKDLENYMKASFPTIAAYMENGAQMHYRPEEGKCAKLKPEGFLLVDTGGLYYDGTTDITRTFVLGNINDEMKRDFTLTLKSHIGLSMAKFLYGATGPCLDVLARKPMWDVGMDFKSGTGHGVGYALNVHESPPGIRYNPTPAGLVKLEEGMTITNEPGVYKEGKWGVRTENTILVVKEFTNTDGTFMRFDTISFCPIDLKAVDKSLLSDCEVKWLNDYHAETYKVLSPFMNDEEKAWLKEETRAI
ncbi:MAG: aminopeptidase P family protein [Treponema sp.]|nr:aminopeptidase P family protein [Treponema sp.]